MTTIAWDNRTRSFQDADIEQIVEIVNENDPPHRHRSPTIWRYYEGLTLPEEVSLHLVVTDGEADDAIVGYLKITDMNTTPFKMTDVCEMTLYVANRARRQGLGTYLYDLALKFAQERKSRRILGGFKEHTKEEPAIAFLTARGFVEQEREKPSYLNLSEFDGTPYQKDVARTEAAGIRLFTYADLEDTPENRHRLYDLFLPLVYDIPRRDDQPFEMEPFEGWEKFAVERPGWTPELYMLAEHDGKLIGMSHVVPKLDSIVASQWLTGVLKEYRGKGVATALKVLGYERARERGIQVIITENHEDNGPMLAINQKFHFQPEPHVVVYNKVLGEG